MKSIYASETIHQEAWADFVKHFKSRTTEASYQTDLDEIMEMFQKDFPEIGETEVRAYYEEMEHKIEQGKIRPSTVAKKFRELHSFAQFLCEQKERYKIREGYRDVYASYLPHLEKQKKFANCVPADKVDRMLRCCEADIQSYTILVLLFRVGLTSTEITKLGPEDFVQYENGLFVSVRNRKQLCYIPDDVAKIVGLYFEQRKPYEYLFYNRNGGPLNLMYISRMMKKLAEKAGVEPCSAESIRNTCGVTMYSYGAEGKQVAEKLGITQNQVHRYRNSFYRGQLQIEAEKLVKLKVLPPA